MIFIFLVDFSWSPECLVDQGHTLTFGLNRLMAHSIGQVVIGIGQVIMDALVIFIVIIWYLFAEFRLWKIKNFRLPATILIFFVVRALFIVNYLAIIAYRDIPISSTHCLV